MRLELSLVLRNFLEQVSDKSASREISEDLPAMETLQISGKFCEVLVENRHPLGLVCIKFLFSEEAPLKV